MPIVRTKNKIQFVQDILSVFATFRHSGKTYLDYLRQSKGGDEFDVRDMIVKPLFRKLGYADQDFYNEVTLQSGIVDLNIGPAPLQPVITVETKATNVQDLKLAREQQLFPYIEELRTPIGIVTNGRSFEIWEQKKGKTLLVKLDFAAIMAESIKGELASLNDEEFGRIVKLMYLKKDVRYIREEELYAIPTIDISEPTSFQRLLDDLARMVELTKLDVEEQFNLHLEDYTIFEQKKEQLDGWQLDKLRREHNKSIQTIKYFHRWAELNNIDLEKNQNGQDKFVTETMYILINRILLIRIAEDKEIIKRRISNGAIEDFKKFIGDVKINYNELLEIAYKRIKGVYEHLFKHDIFDWYVPDSELLLRLLFMFNQYNFAHVNRDILGNLYQKYIDKEERKRLGQFYTPDEVVQYILDAVGYTSDADIENKTLLDPACGSGGFLVPAAHRLISRLRNKNYDPITILNKVRDNIYGFDINPFAAHLTETNLLFQTVDLISEAKRIDPGFRMEQFNVFVTDSLRIPEENQKGRNMSLFDNGLLNSTAVYDAEIVKDIKLKRGRFKDGVDFVVGNPPWGGILKKEKGTFVSDLMKNNYVSAEGKYDIYVLFIEAGIKCLRMEGKLGFIVQNRFLRADYGQKLRAFALQTCQIEQIIDFGDTQIFSDATNYPCIIIFSKKTVDKAKFAFVEVNKSADSISPSELLQLIRRNQTERNLFSVLAFDQESLRGMPAWTYGQVKLSSLFDRVEGIELLGNLCEDIMEGVTFGGKGSDEIFCVTSEIIEQNHLEESLIKKVLKGRDIRKWKIYWSDRFLIYPYEQSGKEIDLKKYPNTFRYLKRFQPTLSARTLDGKEITEWGKKWYSLWRERSGARFESAKIVSPRLATENSFALDEKGDFYLTDSAVAIIPTKLNVKYLLGILNSRLLFFFIKNKSPFVQGRYYSYTRTYIEKLPIKVPSNEKEQRLAKEIIKKVDRILSLETIEGALTFEEVLNKFKAQFLKHANFQLIPLHDCPELKHIEFEKRLGKPNIRQEGIRVYLAKNHYLELANEALAEYIELALTSMHDHLRGLTKPDILRMVQVPKENAVLRAILKYNSDLKKQQVKLEHQRDAIDKEIDERVYELYGITQEERRIIEGK